MADAKKCDRCNKYYDYYSEEIPIDNCQKPMRVNTIGISGIGPYGGQVFDICPDCLHKFADWMNEYTKIIQFNEAATGEKESKTRREYVLP